MQSVRPPEYKGEGRWWFALPSETDCAKYSIKEVRCPYGVPGDWLWVREAWQLVRHSYNEELGAGDSDFWDGPIPKTKPRKGTYKVLYRADGEDNEPWRPSIHMPRWASRLTLELVDVRVERVQDISEGDVKAEGVPFGIVCMDDGSVMKYRHPDTFARPWDSINGGRTMLFEYEDDDGVVHKEQVPANYGWSANPWVWCLTFRKAEDKP